MTIPVELRRKYGFRVGVKVEVVGASQGVLLKPIPDFKELAGIDAGKYTYSEMVQKLDRLRQRWR